MTTPRLAADSVVRHVDDEVLLFVPATNLLHHLNPVAARVWSLCDGRRDTEQMVATLRGEWEVPEEQLRADVTATIEALCAHGLITAAPRDPPVS